MDREEYYISKMITNICCIDWNRPEVRNLARNMITSQIQQHLDWERDLDIPYTAETHALQGIIDAINRFVLDTNIAGTPAEQEVSLCSETSPIIRNELIDEDPSDNLVSEPSEKRKSGKRKFF